MDDLKDRAPEPMRPVGRPPLQFPDSVDDKSGNTAKAIFGVEPKNRELSAWPAIDIGFHIKILQIAALMQQAALLFCVSRASRFARYAPRGSAVKKL